MQRKKFLALMLTAALVGQPGAPVCVTVKINPLLCRGREDL